MQNAPAARNITDTWVSARFVAEEDFILFRSHMLTCGRTTAKSKIWDAAWIESKSAVYKLNVSQEQERKESIYSSCLALGSIYLA